MLAAFPGKVLLLYTLFMMSAADNWSYQMAGHGGPDHWPGVCQQGQAQSPIDITTAEQTLLPPWSFSGYVRVMDNIFLTNNGHSVKFSSATERIPSVTGGGLPGNFLFAQGHFHWGNSSMVGSEHLVGGRAFPLELHLVHYNAKYGTIGEALKYKDGLAVIGIMHEISDVNNPSLDPFIKSLTQIKNAGEQVNIKREFSLSSLLPSDPSSFYRYDGSLTTPGCAEVVTWSLLQQNQMVSEQQLQRLRSILDSDGLPMGDNFRPINPLNGRKVKVTGLIPDSIITHRIVKNEQKTPSGASHWNYQQSGHGGPDHWSGVCESGQAQSPVDISQAESVTLPNWHFVNYEKIMNKVQITNNGHSLKFSADNVLVPSVSGGGLPGNFIFAQGHFHWGNSSMVGSEHLVGGRAFPLELHLVHYNSKYGTIGEALKYKDGLAVIGIMHEISDVDNPSLEPIMKSLDYVNNAKDQVLSSQGFSLGSLLPPDPSAFFRYDGSLTTPGCTEVVTWSLLHQNQVVSEQQLQRLRSLLDSEGLPMGDNFRPVQPLNGRKIKVTGWKSGVVVTKQQEPNQEQEQNQEPKKEEKKSEVSSSIWYFTLVPGWAVVLIALGVAVNVGALAFLGRRRSERGHIKIPTE